VKRNALITLLLLAPACSPPGTPAGASDVAGTVTGLDGKPASNVRVVAYLLADAGGALISNNGGALIGKTKRRLLDVAGEARTDASGHFHLAVAGSANIEAIQADDVRAIKLGVAAGGQVALALDHAGAIAGKVTAPGVTDLEGVDVFVPGTGYVAKAARDGRYTIPNVAAGSFPLVAQRPGLGRARLEAVAVTPGQTTAAPDLALLSELATVTTTDPLPVVPGAPFQLVGVGFGASRGAPFQVTLDGAVADARRIDDAHIGLTAPAKPSAAPVAVVTVDGVAGPTFKVPVLEALGLEPLLGALAPGATQSFLVLAHDMSDGVTRGYDAHLTISGDAASLLPNGNVQALKPGVVRLKVSAGPISYERPLTITAGGASYMAPFAGVGGPGKVDGPAARAAFNKPHGLAFDPAGNLYVADSGNDAIRRIAPNGVVTTVVSTGLKQPMALAWADRLVIADQGNGRVCELAADGSLKTLADNLAVPSGLAVDATGAIYVTEWDRHDVRKLGTDGHSSTVVAGTGVAGFADGPGASARFHFPAGLAADAKGHLYVADGQNHRIRAIDLAAGLVSTLAGSSEPGADTGDYADGPGATAGFYWPIGLSIDPAGNLYVSDTGNGDLRKVTPAGVVSTLTGAAVPAAFRNAGESCVGPDGRVYVCDPTGHQVVVGVF
jgi:sugar lactone lactonase YvrE